MTVFDKAIEYAVHAHAGMERKIDNSPYILHPLEVASIAGTLTSDPEVLAAAVLHDTVEDTDTTPEDILRLFGTRVAALVASETENKREEMPAEATWRIRKEESLTKLHDSCDRNVKILWLSDKLSNMRSFRRNYTIMGKSLWNSFHETNPSVQAWYYRSVASYTKELSDTSAWQEYNTIVEEIFAEVQ